MAVIMYNFGSFLATESTFQQLLSCKLLVICNLGLKSIKFGEYVQIWAYNFWLIFLPTWIKFIFLFKRQKLGFGHAWSPRNP